MRKYRDSSAKSGVTVNFKEGYTKSAGVSLTIAALKKKEGLAIYRMERNFVSIEV